MEKMIGAKVQIRQAFTILDPGPITFRVGDAGKLTGKIGFCVFANGYIVPGIEVSFDDVYPHPATNTTEAVVPFTAIRLDKK